MNKKIMALCALAATICLSSTASAQQNTGDSLFEEIIVTATKREQNIYDVPMAVSAFTEDMLFKQGITDLTDVGKFVPNMTVTGFSAGHVSSVNVFLRGIGLQDHLITTDPGVGVYVDGVYLGRQVGQNWSLANIERVEVLRGPQGTLYGRNSIGGAINIITNKPGDESGGRATLTAGSRGRLNGDFYWNARLSDTFAASFTGSYMSRDGVGDFINFDAGVEVGEMEEWAGRVAAKWDPTEDVSMLFTYDKNDGEGGLRPYTTLIDEVPTGFLYGLVGARNSDRAADPNDNAGAFYFDGSGNLVSQADVTNEADGWSITADWDMTDTLAWKLIYSDRSSEYTSGLDDDSIGFLGGSADPTDPTLGVQFQYPEVGFADQTSTELQLFGDFDGWDFVAGLYYFEEEGGNDQDPNFFLGGRGKHLNYQETESKAIYANVGFQATDRLRLSVGARHTEDDKFAFTDITVQESNSRDWSETSWEIAAAWDMNDRMNLYGTIQNGYQSGQFPPRPFCLFGSLDMAGNLTRPNCFVANDNVTAINYEVGLKGRPADRLSMSVAVFYTDYSDLPYQVSDNTGGGFNTVNIIVDQTSTGLEWESTWAATDQFRLYATLGYIDVDVDDPNPRIVAPLTPELTASISPEFTQPLASGAEIVWRLDWSYRDEMFGQPFNDVPITDIDSRTLINIDIAYHSPDDRWTLAAFGRNVTDEEYDQARLLPVDYVLQILNNDRSEFGLRAVYNFR
jgi:iron complex outermembrane receptor protein